MTYLKIYIVGLIPKALGAAYRLSMTKELQNIFANLIACLPVPPNFTFHAL